MSSEKWINGQMDGRTGGSVKPVFVHESVRKEQMPDEVLQYAKFNNIDVVQKKNMLSSLKALLYPNAIADDKSLIGLQNFFKGK
jgi:hypothetical protein